MAISEYQRRIVDALQSFHWLQAIARKNGDVVQIDPYVYTVQLDAVPLGSKRTASVPIENDSDFYLTQMTAAGVDQTGAALGPYVDVGLVQITDAATNRSLLQAPTAHQLLFGRYGATSSEINSFFNPAPRIFAANSRINVEFEYVADNGAGHTSCTMQFAFIGAKVAFRRGRGR